MNAPFFCHSGTYQAWPYYVVTGLVEIPFVATGSLLFSVVAYWMIGFQTSRFPLFCIVYFVFCLHSTVFGQCIAVWSRSLLVAQQLAPAIISLFSVFAGFLIVKNAIPPYFIWLYYVNPYTYFLEGWYN